MILTLFLLLASHPAMIQGAEPERYTPGDYLWVGPNMASGYNIPFGKRLTIKKVRHLFMTEARIVFEEYPGRRFYVRTDCQASYAFRSDPFESFGLTPEQWELIRRQEIFVGMDKTLFLCIKPRTEEVNYQLKPEGPIEQWIYRENPRDMYGLHEENPPKAIYYFQHDKLIAIL